MTFKMIYYKDILTMFFTILQNMSLYSVFINFYCVDADIFCFSAITTLSTIHAKESVFNTPVFY